MPDVTDLIVACTRVQSDLRAIDGNPYHFPPNAHYERVANLLTVVQAEVTDWMRPRGADRRHGERRHQGERRHGDASERVER